MNPVRKTTMQAFKCFLTLPLALAWLALATGLTPARAQGLRPSATPLAAAVARPAGTPPAPAPLLACVILPSRSADVGTPLAGIVESVEVERGDLVRKGQVLVRMRADVERAASGAAHARASSGADLRAAIAAEALARQKLERARSLLAQDFISAQALEQAESEHRVARERVALATDQREISAREAGGVAAQLSQRVLRAPFDGVVTERFANPGERFEEKPLLRVADVSRLRVDVVASTTLFGRLRAGQELSVQPELPGAGARRAQVVQIDRVMDPASNTFRLRLQMDNPGGELPAGLRCRADIEPLMSAAERAAGG